MKKGKLEEKRRVKEEEEGKRKSRDRRGETVSTRIRSKRF